MTSINSYIHFRYYINMSVRKKAYNSIARSVRSKPINFIFFFKKGRQIKKIKQKQGQRHSADFFHDNNLIWNMMILRRRL